MMKITRTNRNRQGFTLVEIMLAMAIITFGLVILISVVIQSFDIIRTAKQYEIARRMLSLVEQRHPIQLEEVEEGTESGEFDEYPGYTWEREVAIEGIEEDELFRILTRIRWQDREVDEVEEVETLLHLPTAKTMGFISENAIDQ